MYRFLAAIALILCGCNQTTSSEVPKHEVTSFTRTSGNGAIKEEIKLPLKFEDYTVVSMEIEGAGQTQVVTKHIVLKAKRSELVDNYILDHSTRFYSQRCTEELQSSDGLTMIEEIKDRDNSPLGSVRINRDICRQFMESLNAH